MEVGKLGGMKIAAIVQGSNPQSSSLVGQMGLPWGKGKKTEAGKSCRGPYIVANLTETLRGHKTRHKPRL